MLAIGAPVQPPDLSKCHSATDDETKQPVNCCPPYSTASVVDFVPPSPSKGIRVRKPAHELNTEDVEKFKEAIAKMKALPDDDPWSFKQQATIHCTYCNGAFDQAGIEPPVLLQIHGSWLFLPWHRCYLYFWEKILGKLIGDPTFAIPFWNWDAPEGMYMPKIYLGNSSSLYNDNRDKNHYESVFDYKYAYNDQNPTCPSQVDKVIRENLCQVDRMYKETIRNPELFMGKALRAGQSVPTNASGSLENLHNSVHQWSGPSESPYYDMGNFHTAARDPLFFGHHANIDRMRDLYNNFRGHRPEFKDPDWLEASFIFYDENRQVVKVKVKDCLTSHQLRYAYSPEKLPWMNSGLKCRKEKASKKKGEKKSLQLVPVSEFGTEPRTLTETIRVIVPRPQVSRKKGEKEEASEVLVIRGIHAPHGTAARFDVYVSKPIEGLVSEDRGEFAGSFVKIPHTQHKTNSHGHKSSLELGITILHEDIEAEDSKKLVVTLVPRMGKVIIGGVDVDLFKVDDYED
ncbi:hypothetical protein GIB67_003838 [Kingdonia uniflora]|uniref:Tyrosinase copper-binding domain-containing protein n=1 Tax=Kingdonia uniflora TaxID=39325 RepID=A0A7J7NY73_9MAGN|nr:hypothetical protein GIB67_003838 [Kingdonia uniflora]